jgi:methylated-DNA-[protein]-cysteine S-methyltransferase
MGWVGILASERGLVATTLPQHSIEETEQLLGNRLNQATRSSIRFVGLVERFKLYFKGEKVTFSDELDLSEATPFQQQVWQVTRLIPYGETRSYLWLAMQIGRPEAVRAVGQALGRNPLPIIVPCHRVVASNGGLGGFSGGIEMKKRLLNLESSADKFT